NVIRPSVSIVTSSSRFSALMYHVDDSHTVMDISSCMCSPSADPSELPSDSVELFTSLSDEQAHANISINPNNKIFLHLTFNLISPLLSSKTLSLAFFI